MIRGKPVAKVKDDSREKACFRQAEQKSEEIKGDRASSERHCDRDKTPGDHYPPNPETCSHFMQNDCRGHFKHKVAKKEDARTKAEHLRRQAHILVHSQSRESYVDPVEKCYEIEQHQERNKSPCDLANRLFFQEAVNRFSDVAHPHPLAIDPASNAGLPDCTGGLGMRLDRQRLKTVRVSALRGRPASILATVGET